MTRAAPIWGFDSHLLQAAVAAAAAARGVRCTVVVPRTTPPGKVANMERYGANVVKCEPTQTARTNTAMAEAERMGGAAFIHPYNDPLVLAGQGTIGLELLEQCAPGASHPPLDAVLVPVSGGGMIGGIALAIKALRPEVRIIACEPEGKDLQGALAAGTRVIDASTADAALDTIADAIRTKAFGDVPWEVAAPLLEPTVLSVNDDQIRDAMRTALVELKQVVEPAGAVTLAALLSPEFGQMCEAASADAAAGKREAPLGSVAAILCGGNIDAPGYAQHVAQ
jgi:serine racemase